MRENNLTAEKAVIKTERIQISHGRAIRAISVFPAQASATPEDKLKALVELDFQQQKLCA